MSRFRRSILLTLVATVYAAWPQETDPGQLPPPTGAHAAGRITLVVDDPTRLEPLGAAPVPRRIGVDVWYPAESTAGNAGQAEYLDIAAYERHLGERALGSLLGNALASVRAGTVGSHALPDAPFARSVRAAPVLLFSPGGGMVRELYTAQLSDLASHGYVVAAVTHSYDGALTLFPDGTAIAHEGKRWPRVPSVEGEPNRNQLEWHTADLQAVLESLRALRTGATPFAGRMDFSRVGAFGHSFGGVTAAHACQRERLLRACANQDGAMGMKPYILDAKGWGMDQAFLLLERPPNTAPLTEADLAELKLTRPRAEALINQLNRERDTILARSGKGSVRILLRREVSSHMDFSDLPLLGARSEADIRQRRAVMDVIRRVTRAFFDHHLRGFRTPLPFREVPGPVLEFMRVFPPARALQ